MRITTRTCFVFYALVLSTLAVACGQNRPDVAKDKLQTLQETFSLVREAGTIESAKAVEVVAPYRGSVLWVVDEGTRVEQGDPILTLDSSAIEEELVRQKIELSKAEAALQATKGEVDNARRELEGAATLCEERLRLAKLKLETFVGEAGEHQSAEQDLSDQLAVARKHVEFLEFALGETRARQEGTGGLERQIRETEAKLLAASKEMARLNREQKRLTQHKAIRVAELKVALLVQELELRSVSDKLKSELARGAAASNAAQLAYQSEQLKLERLQKQLQASKVQASQAGVVLYPPPRRGSPVIEIGAVVAERQTVLEIADFSELQVVVRVNETRIARVRPGQPAEIRVDALPDRSFRGTVKQVGRVPEQASFLQESVKEYRVIVSLGDPSPDLRVGMNAMVDIQTQRRR